MLLYFVPMRIEFEHAQQRYHADLSKTIDISIPLMAGEDRLEAWYVDPIRIEPVRGEGFVGAVAQGGSVNFRNIYFNPHGHGTHTECMGHITEKVHSVNEHFQTFHMPATLVTLEPESRTIDGEEDLVITAQMIPSVDTRALIIRTSPNKPSKLTKHYSSTNPPYMLPEAMEKVVSMGVEHLLIDLPSVDREVDGGKLLCHHLFWQIPEAPRTQATITELIYVPDEVEDGLYLMNLQTAPFENDASPIRPVLFRMMPI